jgi:hypothetical protein
MFEAEQIAGTDFEPNVLIEFIRPPFRKYQFSTRMSAAHAAEVLREIVEPRKTFRWRIQGDHRYFEGAAEHDRFKINRIIKGRDSFRPIIEGTFRERDSGSLVILNMRMAWPTIVFCSCFIALSSLFAMGGTVALFGMALFMYFLASICFAIEVRIAMKRLLELLRSGDNAVGS